MSWLSRLSPIPVFPAYTGPHRVGTVDVEVPSVDLCPSGLEPPSGAAPTIAFRLFYPCDEEAGRTQARPVRWIPQPQKSVIASMAKLLGSSSWMAEILSRFSPVLTYISLPAQRNAKIKKSLAPSNRWPVVIFSHGLAGSRNLYSQICGSIASYGVVVVALDHRDGSSPVQHVRATADTAEQIISSIKISHDPVPETFKARDRQLRIRIHEIALAFNALSKIDSGEPVDNLDPNNSTTKKERVEVLTNFRDTLDIYRPGAMTWMGHSFGAATMIQLVKSVYYSTNAPKDAGKSLFTPEQGSLLTEQITAGSPVALLDLWGLPLQSPDTSWLADRAMPCYSPSSRTGGHALLAVLSEAFHDWSSNREQVRAALGPPSGKEYTGPRARLFWPADSEHFSQSDVGLLFPRLTGIFTKARDPEYALELNTRAVLQTMRENGVVVADSKVTSTAAEGTRVSARYVEDDSAILAEPEKILGWKNSDLRTEAVDENRGGETEAVDENKGGETEEPPTMGVGKRDGKPDVVTDGEGKVV